MTENAYATNPFAPEDWHEDAVCATTDPDLFFPERGDKGKAKSAKELCASCPVQSFCLEYALRAHPVDGIWAGTTMNQRAVLIREQPESHHSQKVETYLAIVSAIKANGKPPTATEVAHRLGVSVPAGYAFLRRVKEGWVPRELSKAA